MAAYKVMFLIGINILKLCICNFINLYFNLLSLITALTRIVRVFSLNEVFETSIGDNDKKHGSQCPINIFFAFGGQIIP